jgi:hypothetical protein
MHDGRLLSDKRLADPHGPPVAFLTIPEGIAGFTGDAVLSRVGYTAAQVAGFHGQAAAIVFRYPQAVQSLPSWDGDLGLDVQMRVVRATWKNLFRTFKDLAEIGATPLKFEDDDRRFVASFPSWGQKRLMGASYYHVQSEGGADWRYRWYLENLLWVTPEFLGTGWADDANGPPSAPEYLGPNVSLSTLAAARSFGVVSL